MIFKEVIAQILFERGIDCETLASDLDISVVHVKNLLTGVTKKPKDGICNKIIDYCKKYGIDIHIDWNDVLYDAFVSSNWYHGYVWLNDLNDEGYVLLKHKRCGKNTLVPLNAFGTSSVPCIHCWVERYVSLNSYDVKLSEHDYIHEFRHICGHVYTVTYDEIKQKKFRCPICQGHRYSIDNIKNHRRFSSAGSLYEKKASYRLSETPTDNEMRCFLRNIGKYIKNHGNSCDTGFSHKNSESVELFETLTHDEWWDFLVNIGKYMKTEETYKDKVYMEIKIMSRKDIERHCAFPLKKKTAVISICDVSDSFASLLFKPEYLLQLPFDDVDSDIFGDVLGEAYSVEEAREVEEGYNMFSETQAVQVTEFINEIWDKVDVLICQCEHGQSRSAAIAAAIAEFKFNRGIDIFADERYYPNKFVYWRVLNKLKEMKTIGG